MKYLDEGYVEFSEKVIETLGILQSLMCDELGDIDPEKEVYYSEEYKELEKAYQHIRKSCGIVIKVGVEKMLETV